MKQYISNTKLARAWIVAALLLAAHSSFAAAVDVNKLPPPAAVQVDFARDIKPIFEASCINCHGPGKPKSQFRLDSRAAALKGGENGVDILPGDSAKSPLIHYVARIAEDIEMPPEGKGEPLTREQVGLLRAWIDQGAKWEEVAPAPAIEFSASPVVGWTTVNGSASKFREHHWQREGWNGGAEQFELKARQDGETKLIIAGHALRDDYKVTLELKPNDLVFVRIGGEQFRKYYDDLGGYNPLLTPSAFRLDRDLHLDVGRAWADFGLVFPNGPRLVFGYEYQYKDGEKSMLQWGPASDGGDTKNIYPVSKAIKESVHVIKFDFDHEIAGVHVEDSFRGEFYELTTRRPVGSLGSSITNFQFDVRDEQRHFQGANVIRLEKRFTDWLFTSGGYLYSKLNGDAAYAVDFIDVTQPGSPVTMFPSQGIVLERESHTGNANLLLGPWAGLTLSSGVQTEWTRQTGVGDALFDAVFLPVPRTVVFRSDRDTAAVEEQIALRYTRVPATVLFAEARLRQESRGTFEMQDGGDHDFVHDTDATSDLRDLRAGFRTSPSRFADFSAHYRRYEKENNYHHTIDDSGLGGTSFPALNGVDYPAFILAQKTATDEIEARLVLRPVNWLKTTFTCKLLATDFHTDTGTVPKLTFPGPVIVTNGISPGGSVFSGNYDANVYNLNLTVTPWRRLYLSSTFSCEQSRTLTYANGSPSVVPYRGDTYSVVANATFVCDVKTDLFATYAFSRADYSQNNYADGLPVGIEYDQHSMLVGVKRRLNKNLSTRLQYGFYSYNEPSSGGLNNYTAHAIFGALNFKLP